MTIAAGASPVVEGTAATFTLSRTIAETALTATVSVTETGDTISGTAPTQVVFGASAATATLTVATENDAADEANSMVTATVSTGTGYTVGTANSATVTVRDDETNSAPTSANKTVTLVEDGTHTFSATDFAFTDSDSGDELTSVRIATLPGLGSLALDDSPVSVNDAVPVADLGDLVYTPVADGNGDSYTTFTFKVSDGLAESATANTMTLDVTPVADAPVVAVELADQTATTGRAFSYVVPADAFTDADGDTLIYSAARSNDSALPSWLTFTAATRTFTGTPGAGDAGTVALKVTVKDSADASARSVSDTFDLVVSANSAPTSANKTVTLVEDGTHTFSAADFAFTDSDSGDELTSVRIATLPGLGSLALDDNAVSVNDAVPVADLGDLVFTPVADGNGDAYTEFTFKVSDGVSESNAAYTLTLDVTPVADAPVVDTELADQTATTGRAYTYVVPADAFTDADGDTLIYSAARSDDSALPSWLTFAAATRTFAGTPGAGDTGTVTLKVTVKDSADASARSVSDEFDLTVGANSAPTSANKTVTLAEDATYAFATTDFAFTDSDSNDELTSVRAVTLPGLGSLTLDGSAVTAGDVVPVADLGDLVFTPVADGNGDAYTEFTFKVSDGVSESNAAYTLTLDVTPVADAPVVDTELADQTATTGRAYTYVVPADAFTDADGDTLIYSAARSDDSALPSWLTFAAATRTFTGTPGAADAGTVALKVTVKDSPNASARSVSDEFDLVVGANSAPTSANKTVTLVEDGTHTFSATDFAFTDSDSGDELTSVRAVTLPGLGSLALDDNAVSVNDAVPAADLGDLVFTPVADGNGDAYTEFTFKVSDGVSESNAAYTLTIDVTAVADAPVVDTELADQTATTGRAYTYVVPADAFTDADGDTLIYSAARSDDSALPSWLSFSAATRTFTGTPGAADTGTVALKVTVKDSADASARSVSDTFDLVVSANSAPTSANKTVTLVEDGTHTFSAADFAFTDSDSGDELTSVRIVTLPGLGSLALDDNAVSVNDVVPVADLGDLAYTPVADGNGDAYTTFMFKVSDGVSESNAAYTLTLDVTPVADAPAITTTSPKSVAENTTAVTTLTATDADDDTLTWSKNGGADAARFGLTSAGVLTFASAPDYENPTDSGTNNGYVVNVRVSDGTATADLALTVNVTDANEPPAAPAAPAVAPVSGSTTSLSVTWTAPTNTGKPTIAHYDLQHRIGTSGPFTTGPQDQSGLTATILDLDADTAYEVQVRATNADGDGTWSPSGTGRTNATAATAPVIVTGGIAVTSNPRSGDTYGTGERIKFSATFDQPVAVTGTPEFEFSLRDDVDHENVEFATLTDGSGTPTLVFSYTVQLGDSDNDGIWIGDQNHAVTLRSGDAIRGTVGGLDAVIIHAAPGRLPSHKVDGQPVANTPPSITTTSPISVAENTTAVTTLTATDADDDTLTWSKNGGADAARFGLTSAGVLTFASAPDYENPTDSGTNNGYVLTVEVSDGIATAELALTVNVTDANERPAAPAAPAVAPVSGSTTSLSVTWTAPTNTGKPTIAHYDLQHRIGTSGPFTTGPQDQSGPTATILNLTADTAYEVQVRATNADGDGTWSPSGTGRTNAVPATAPTIVTGGVAVTSTPTSSDTYGTGETITIGVTFDQAVAVTGTPEFEFSLADSGASENVERAALTGGAGTTALIFSYTVQAGDSDDNGISIGDQDDTLKLDSGDAIRGAVGGLDAVLTHAAPGTQSSHKVDGQPVVNTPPAITTTSPISVAENTTAVTTLTATDADDDTLTWSKNGGADAARFDLTSAGVLTFVNAPDFENPTDTDNDNDNDNGYAVTVRVSDGTATADLDLTVIVAEAGTLPAAPTGLTASPHERNRIHLSWVAPTDTGKSAITGYRIEVSSDAGRTWSDLVANTGRTGTTYEHTGLAFGSIRHYQVSAINAEGTGSPSNVAGASTDARPVVTFSHRVIPFIVSDGTTSRIPKYEVTIAFSTPVETAGPNYHGLYDHVTVTNGSFHSFGAVPSSENHNSQRYSVWRAEVVPNAPPGGGTVSMQLAVPDGVMSDREGRLNRAASYTIEAVVPNTDGLEPQVSINRNGYSEFVTGPFTVRVVFSEPMTGFAEDELSVSGGQVTAWDPKPGGDVYVATIDPDRPSGETGTVTLSVSAGVAEDAAGNLNTASLPIEFSVRMSRTVQARPLTAMFRGVPREHDGGSFTFRIDFSDDIATGSVSDALSATGATLSGVRAMDGRRDVFEITVQPGGNADVTLTLTGGRTCGTTGALCTAAGVALADNLARTVWNTSPSVAVSNARVEEGPGAMLEFEVTLDHAAAGTVTVDYATTDGTAMAGSDYTAVNGTLTFAAGVLSKTISVAVFNDSHDEGEEALFVVLSNARGAYLGQNIGLGLIDNSDPMPQAWLARFGRAASDHAVQAIEGRWRDARLESPDSHLTLGGWRVDDLFGRGRTDDGLDPESGERAEFADEGQWARMDRLKGETMGWGLADGDLAGGLPAVPRPGTGAGAMPAPGGPVTIPNAVGGGPAGGHGGSAFELPNFRDLLVGSSFLYSRPQDGDGDLTEQPGWLGQWSAWGETAATRFSGADGPLSLAGDVATATLGVDSRWDRWIAGVALSYSEGEGAYTHREATGGAVTSAQTSLHPFARYEFNDRTSVWGVLGYGVGGLTLTSEGQASGIEADLTTTMAALGGRGVLSRRAGGFELAVVSDALLTNSVSEAAAGLMGAAGATNRLRLMLEGSGQFELGSGAGLRPTLEAGLRYDGGDAERGAGLEVGGGLAYAAGRVAVEVNARALLAHADTDYEEWGFSGSIVYRPRDDGRGLSMNLGSAWGATQSGVQSLWTRQDASGLVHGGATEAAQRFQAELGYGFQGRKGDKLWVPYVGAEGGAQALRMGLKLTSGAHREVGLEFGRLGNRHEAPRHAVELRGAMRW